MTKHPVFLVSLAFNLGVLFTLACSDGGPSSALAEVVAAAVRAVDVEYDDTQSQLDASDVQAALVRLDERLDASESANAALRVELDASKVLVTALESRATSLEAKVVESVAAAEVTVGSGADARPLTDVLTDLGGLAGELATLTTSTVDTEAGLSTLGVTVQRLYTCPEGTDRVGSACIEKTARPLNGWAGGVFTCALAAGRLCAVSEYTAWCNQPGADKHTKGLLEFANEFATGSDGSAGHAQLVSTTHEDCSTEGSPIATFVDLYGYRCCFDRINLDLPAPPN